MKNKGIKLRTISRSNPINFQHQQGVVIVVALFFVALVAAMSYYMMGRLEGDTRRTQLLLRDVKAELYAQGSIAWAMEQLRTDFEKGKVDVVVDSIPIQSPVNEINSYKISSVIYDAQSRINLNNLVNADAQVYFKHLLNLIDASITEQKAQEIVLAIVDWITPGQQQNEFNKYYMSLSPAYRAAHRPMVSASELQLVKGISPKLYSALQNYITALPTTTFINVQTAPAAVLAAVSPTMTLETGMALQEIRSQMAIVSTEVFLKLDLVKNHPMLKPENTITVISNYFLVETRVEIESQRVVLYTLIERIGGENKCDLRIVWQSKGISG